MLILAVIGVLHVNLGLELSDVIPTGTPEHEFLVAREKYFSFYPMYGVIRKPTKIHLKQKEMQRFREEILNMSYTVSCCLFSLYVLFLIMAPWPQTSITHNKNK